MNTAKLIQDEVKTLPDFKVQEVLDFILFLKTRNEDNELQDIVTAQEQPLSDPHKPYTNLISEMLKIGNNCASLPLLDNRTIEEILGYDESGMPK